MVSRALAFRYFCLTFILGISLGPLFQAVFKYVFFLILICLFFSIFLFKKGNKKLAFNIFLILFCLLGVYRYLSFRPFVNHPLYDLVLNQQNGLEVTLTGKIISQIQGKNTDMRFNVKIDQAWLNEEKIPSSELISVTLPKIYDFSYGDLLFLKGSLKLATDSLNKHLGYLTKDNIFLTMYDPEIKVLGHNQGNSILRVIYKTGETFQNSLNKSISEPSVSLVSGLILGNSAAGFDAKFSNALRQVGLSHIVAVSGYNLTILAESLSKICLFLGFTKNISFGFSSLAIIVFCLLTGASASVIRSGIMALVLLLAQRISRTYYSVNALLLAGVIMLLFNPLILTLDLGFQLSFLATLGLIYLGSFWQRILKGEKRSFLSWRANLATTASALTMVSPWIFYKQDTFSLIAPLSNLLVVPLIPLLMFLGFCVALSGMLWPFLGNILGFLALWPSQWVIILVNFFSKLSFSQLVFNFHPVLKLAILLISYFFIIRLAYNENKRTHEN
ncbi:MAG: ComEC/Rec2 family competence protein [Candidatus Parcubacteria bacterium]|nr:ComEC/Rec2 family competence protein [Candidatus Parcubacteria bacterium]